MLQTEVGDRREEAVSDLRMVRVLGPIDRLTADGIRPFGGRQPQAVLGTLVVALGHAVTADQLIAVVWGDEPPMSAPNSLQVCISRLRGMLGSSTIEREDHTYTLHLDPDLVDACIFERLVGEAAAMESDPPGRRRTCDRALGLWRGRPFGDLADEDPFRLETLRLDELRLLAMELRLTADFALGRSDLVVGVLEAAVEENPYRERLWLLLIEALAREGRRVEALRTAERLRQMLGEVGLDAGAALRCLEDAIASDTLDDAPVADT